MSTYLATFFVRFRGDVKDLVGERKHFIVEAPAKSRNSQNHSEGLDNLTGLLSRRNRTSESNVQEKKAENALVLNVKIRRRQKDGTTIPCCDLIKYLTLTSLNLDAGQSYYLRTVPEPLYRPQKLAAAKELSELEGFSDTTVPEVGATRAYWLKIALGWGIRPAAAPASLRDDAASPSSSSTPPGQLTPATPEPSSSSPSPTPHLGQISHSEAGTPSLSLESRPTNSAVISMDSSSTPGLADEKHGIVSDAAASSALTKKERMLLKAREAARTSILKEKEEQQQSVEDAQKNEALSNKLWRFIVPKKQ
jgi:hypothetical protein